MFYLVKNKSEIITEAESKGKLRAIYKRMTDTEKAIHKVSKIKPDKINPDLHKNDNDTDVTKTKIESVSPFDDLLDDEITEQPLSKKEARRLKRRNAKLLKTMHIYKKMPAKYYAR